LYCTSFEFKNINKKINKIYAKIQVDSKKI
jgi:hypothetical protein